MTSRIAYWIILTLLFAPLRLLAQPALTLVEKTVAVAHPVANITFNALKEALASKDSAKIVLFDTRKPDEYNTSHLRSAIRLDPDMDAARFIEQHGARIKNKDVIFYCSVGYRSSIFIERLQKQIAPTDTLSLTNLQGGIFRWYNEKNPVVDHQGETDAIHPYDIFWGKLIKKRNGEQIEQK